MARMTVADVVDDVTDEIPGIATAKIVRAMNKVLRRIHAETNVMAYSTFTTRVATTSGTVTATQDSTAISFSGTPLAATDPIMLIQITGDDTWFLLTYASTSTGTLSSKWAEATATTVAYTIVYPTVSFPQPVGAIHRIWRVGFNDLMFIGDRGGPGDGKWSTIGIPDSWAYYGHDSATATPNDELLRIQLRPASETRDVFSYSYTVRPTLLTPTGATSQVIPLPDIWNEVVIAGTLSFCWSGRDTPERAGYWLGEYERGIHRVRGQTNQSGSVSPRPVTMTQRRFATQATPEVM